MNMVLGSRIVDTSSLVLGADYHDADYADVWYTSAEFMDGTPLTGEELEELYYQYPVDEDMVERYGM